MRGHLAAVIPKFHGTVAKQSVNMSPAEAERELLRIRAILQKGGRNGLDKSGFATIVTDVWGFPSFFVRGIFKW